MSRRGTRRAGLVAATLILLLTGCGAGQPSSTRVAAGDAAPAGATEPARSTVRVGLFEWSIATSTHNVSPGRVRLVVTNTGATEHDLAVQGSAGRWQTPTLEPGDRSSLTVRARPGETLRLWCTEPGHREQGMHTTLHVK